MTPRTFFPRCLSLLCLAAIPGLWPLAAAAGAERPEPKIVKLAPSFTAENAVVKDTGDFVSAVPVHPVGEFALSCSQPPVVPAKGGRIGVWIYARTNGEDTLDVKFKMADANGTIYWFNTTHDAWSSLRLPSNAWCYVESYPFDAKQGSMLPGSVARSEKNPAPLPKFPLKFLGLTVLVKQKPMEGLAIADVSISNLDRRQSAYYWQANDRSLTAEETSSRNAFVLTSDYADKAGKYRLAWRIENPATGAVVGAGTQAFSIAGGGEFPRREKIALPLLPQGSYKLTTKLAVWNGEGWKIPAEPEVSWMLVFQSGAKMPKRVNGTSEEWRVAIDGKNPSGIRPHSDRLDVPYSVLLRGLRNDGGLRAEWAVDHYDGHPVARGTASIPQDAGEWFGGTMPVPVSDSENVFASTVSVFRGKDLIDRQKKLVGFAGASKPVEIQPGSVPAVVDPAIFVGVTAMGPKFRDDARYEKHLETFKKMGFTGIEYAVEWAFLEPLPGCFTFEEMDRHLALARKLGFKIMLRLRAEFPRYTVPDWVSADFLCQQDGKVDGLIASGPVFSPCDRQWTEASRRFQTEVVRHYANDPSVVSFKVCQNIREAYWIDRPFKYQFTDYSLSATNAFRSYVRHQYKTLEAAGAAHQAVYKSWREIELPQPYVRPGDLDLSGIWKDFCAFKTETYNRHLQGTVTAIHHAAPAQHLYVYSINALTGPPSRESLLLLKNSNASLAAGGSLPVGEVGYTRLYGPAYGLSLITEPNTYSMQSRNMMDDHAGMVLEGAVGQGPRMFAYWPARYSPDMPGSGPQEALVRMSEWDQVLKQVRKLTFPSIDIGLAFSWEGMSYQLRGFYSASLTECLNRPYLKSLRGRGIEAVGIDDTFDAKMMAERKVIIMPPEASPVISRAMLDSLTAYVSSGGHLVMAQDSGARTPDAPGETAALAKALGVVSGEWPESGVRVEKVGAGTVLLYRDTESLRKAVASEDFAQRMNELGVRRYVAAEAADVVATLHDGQDGNYYLYVLNQGQSPEAAVNIMNLPAKAAAFKIEDLLNKNFSGTVSLSDSAGQTVHLPLTKGMAGFYKLTPLP